MKKQEVWKVTIGSKQYKNQKDEYFVFATSITKAEQAGIKAAKEDGADDPYCNGAEFSHYVWVD